MGVFPCSNHGTRFRGAAQHAYPALVDGQESERAHLRLCPDCFADYTAMLANTLIAVDYDSTDPDVPPACWSCSTRTGLTPVFANTYPKGSEEVDYFGHTCPGDKEALALKLLVR